MRVRGYEVADAAHLTSLEITSDPGSDGVYTAGETIAVTATLSEATTFSGPAPVLPIVIGANTREAAYQAAASTSTSWVFHYVVTNDDADNDGISIEQHRLRADADADLGHNQMPSDPDHPVNAQPVIESVTVTSSPVADKYYGPGETIQFTATFSIAVQVTGDPQLQFNIGSTMDDDLASYVRVDEGNKVIFEYVVGTTEHDDDGIFLLGPDDVIRLDSNDSIVAQWNSSKNAILTPVPRLGGQDGHRISQDPRLANIAVTSTPTSGADSDTYGFGDIIEFTATFNQDVVVVGDPRFEFSITDPDNNPDYALYHGGSGGRELVFQYVVRSSDDDPDGIWIPQGTDAFDLDSGDTIQGELNSLDAVFDYRQLGTQGVHKIDGTIGAPPALASATVNAAGTQLDLVFDEAFAAPTSYTALAGRFGVTADGASVSFTLPDASQEPDNARLVLSLSTAIERDQVVVVTYTDPTTGDDSDVIEDAVGNEAATFTTGTGGVVAVTNNSTAGADTSAPTVTSATVNAAGTVINVVFDEMIDHTQYDIGDLTAALTVSADGRQRMVPSVTVRTDGSVDIAPAQIHRIREGQLVVLSYTDPAGDQTDVLQDAAGNDVASFTTGAGGVPAVANNSTFVDDEPPEFVGTPDVVASGDSLEIYFTDVLAVPEDAAERATFLETLAEAFALTANGAPVPLSIDPSSRTDGGQLQFDLSRLVGMGHSVVLKYTKPGPGAALLKDESNNEAASFTTGIDVRMQ